MGIEKTSSALTDLLNKLKDTPVIVQYEYSIDGLTNWTSTYSNLMCFVRFSFDEGATFSDAIEFKGPAGDPGAQVEMQNDGTNIQWKLSTEIIWNNLISILAITGKQVVIRNNGTHIQWRYAGETWTNLVSLSDLTGDAGRGITDISKTDTVDLVDTYTISYSDSTTSEFYVTNGKDGVAATIEVGTVTTVPNGSPATVNNSGTPNAAVFDFEIPEGDTGKSGQGYISKGPWVSGDDYVEYDIVTDDGSTYECYLAITNSTVIPATDTTHFRIWASKGADGQNEYLYVAYASDASGTDWNLTPDNSLKYRAEIQSTTALTPVEADFSGATWVKYIGDDGLNSDIMFSSNSAVVMGLGTKHFDFITPAYNLQVNLGARMRCYWADGSNDGTIYMEGIISDIDNTYIEINVDYTHGANTTDAWYIYIAGDRGADGADGVVTEASVELVLDAATADTLTDASTINFNKSSVLKKITWTNIKTALATVFDLIYVKIASPKFTGDVNMVGVYKYYNCASDTADTIGDTRNYFDLGNDKLIWEQCTVANAAKGGGTWVQYALVKGSNTGDQTLPTIVTFGGGYAACGTAIGTQAKTVALTGYTLVVGGVVGVTFTNGNNAASPTLNINGAGAKPIFVNGAAVAAIPVGFQCELSYDGTNYNVVGNALPTAVTPSTQAFGDAAVVGTSLDKANADHKHAMPAAQTLSGLGGMPLAGGTFTGNPILAENVNIQLTAPATTNGHATGIVTNAFNSGYSSSAIGDLVYLDSNGTWQKADNTTSATTYGGMLGIALEVKASGNALLVALSGTLVYSSAFPTLTVGSPVYMSTAGAVVVAQPSAANAAIRILGYATTTKTIYFVPSSDYIVHV